MAVKNLAHVKRFKPVERTHCKTGMTHILITHIFIVYNFTQVLEYFIRWSFFNKCYRNWLPRVAFITLWRIPFTRRHVLNSSGIFKELCPSYIVDKCHIFRWGMKNSRIWSARRKVNVIKMHWWCLFIFYSTMSWVGWANITSFVTDWKGCLLC